MINKKTLFTALSLVFCSSIFAGSYQNNIRSTQDRTKSVFRILKSTGAIESLSEVQIPILSGYIATTTAAVLTMSSEPGLEAIGLQKSIVIDWADGEKSPVAFSIRVPFNYNSGGAFILEALSESNVATSTKIRVSARVNGGTSASATAIVTSGSFEDVSTDIGSLLTLTIGDDLTFIVERLDSTSGTGTLQIKNPVFKYNESMTFTH